MSLISAFVTPSPVLNRSHFATMSNSCDTKRRPRHTFVTLPTPHFKSTTTTSQLNNDRYDNNSNNNSNNNNNNNNNSNSNSNSNNVYDNQFSNEQAQAQQGVRPIFLNDRDEQFWESTDVDKIFSPLRSDEEEILKSKLPLRLARFFIDRANDANRLRQPNTNSPLFADLPPDTPNWEDPINLEYSNYVYVTTTGAPQQSFRRKSSSLFGGGDGLPNPNPEDGLIGEPYIMDGGEQIIRPINDPDSLNFKSSQPRVVSLFVGQVDSIDEQASRLGYGIIAILAFSFLLKLVFAVISFFLSFTFSFFAIFALSAGIFVLFFIIRF